ncbi:MAG: hypothetical protein ACRC06_05600 [Waterburya sp.]
MPDFRRPVLEEKRLANIKNQHCYHQPQSTDPIAILVLLNQGL